MYKVLAADQLSAAGLQPLQTDSEFEVHDCPRISPRKLLQVIPAYDALIVRSRTEVTAEVIRAGKRLQVVARAGTGVDNIDLEVATECGVLVVNAPTGNSVAAAEHTIAMLMAMARHVPQADADIRQGNWEKTRWIGHEVREKVFGTIGLGRVALEVVKVVRELGMQVIATDPFVATDYASQHGVQLVDMDTLLRESDFISVHVPLTKTNMHLLGAAELAKVKTTARVLNVARGGLVDETALVQAIADGRLAGAALDVFEEEPLSAGNPLRDHPNIVLTPHLGASTHEAQNRVARDVCLQIQNVLRGGQAQYAVNAPIVPPRDLEVLVPYIDLATRLGRFLTQVETQGAKQIEVTTHGPIAEMDMSYILAGAVQGALAGVLEERVNVINAQRLAAQRGMNLVERKQAQHRHRYTNMLTMTAITEEKRWTVRGALLHGEPNIVAIDNLWVEFVAQGHILLTSHIDRPGMIGQVGTLLGEADVNISFMHVGRKAPRQQAIMVIGTDEKLSVAVYESLCDLAEFTWVRTIEL